MVSEQKRHERGPEIRISDLCRDPTLAAFFRRAEGDGLAPAEYDRPISPRQDGTAARRILEAV